MANGETRRVVRRAKNEWVHIYIIWRELENGDGDGNSGLERMEQGSQGQNVTDLQQRQQGTN